MIGYCIGAYVRPGQTARLVRRLLHDDPAGQVVLHFDQRQASFDPGEVAGPRVTLVPEHPVHWGGFDQVQLSIDMMRIATEQLHCLYVVMLSGQDYPLCHVGGLQGELAHFDVWAEIRPLVRDGEVMWPEAMRRYSYRWWCLSEPGRLLLALDYHVAAKSPVSTGPRGPAPAPGRALPPAGPVVVGARPVPALACRSTPAAHGRRSRPGRWPPSCPLPAP